MTVAYEQSRGVYHDADRPEDLNLRHYWTAFCGGCGEEIDAAARTEGQARAVVEAAIARDYEPVEIDRIERRYRGIIYV